MSDYVLFQMWGPFRQSLIASHLFYVEQARKRLLVQFDDIDTEADAIGVHALERNSKLYNPDSDNGDHLQEDAYEQMCEFHRLLSDMRDQTRLSVVAGMFHEWDKQLRDWLVREIQHWHHGDTAALKVWSADFVQIAELLESIGWPVCGAEYFRMLDACRLVVNVYKHGAGKSLEDLKQKYPEYLDCPFGGSGTGFSSVQYRDHTHLKVSDDQFQAFSNAIVAFWHAVPENIFESKVNDVPDWFGKAILKDRTGQQQASK
jgi:hypothetical protein